MINKNLYTKELKRNRKNLAIWSSIVIGFTLMVATIYPFMAEMGEGLNEIMDKMPPELGRAMGMDAATWSSILGFYSTYYGVYIIVLISIFTGSTATTILAKEERDHTSEFLMTRPVSRRTIFLSKMASLFSLSFLIYMIQLIVAVVAISFFAQKEVDWSIFIRLHLAGLFLMMLFTSLGVLISMFVSPKKNMMGAIVGLCFGTFLLDALGKSTEATNWLSYFSPFNYFNMTIAEPAESFRIISAIVIVLISVMILYFSSKRFDQKDFSS